MKFKRIENTSVAQDIVENLATLHTKSRYSAYSLKGLCHAYTTLRTKTRHKFLHGLNEKELKLFLDSYNTYISKDNEDPKIYKVLVYKPKTINELLKKRKAWKNRNIEGDNPLMDMEAQLVSKTEISKYLDDDCCIYLISSDSLRIESEIHSVDELLPFTLMTLPEASRIWGLGESTLRGTIKRSKVIKENIDYRKSGHIYLITESGMKKLYGESKINAR